MPGVMGSRRPPHQHGVGHQFLESRRRGQHFVETWATHLVIVLTSDCQASTHLPPADILGSVKPPYAGAVRSPLVRPPPGSVTGNRYVRLHAPLD